IDIQTTTPIVLTHGELVLAHDLTIDFTPSFAAPGTQAVISGDFLSRIFEVTPAAHVKLFDLDIIDGNGLASNLSGTKAADSYGAGILNPGTLTLTRCALSENGVGNNTTGIHESGPGGAIFNDGQTGLFAMRVSPVGRLTLAHCELIGNSSAEGG